MYFPLENTMHSWPKHPEMICRRGSRLGIRVVNSIESSSEKTTTSYSWLIFFKKLWRPGLLWTIRPFPNTYSVSSNVPVTFKTSVFGWIWGWTMSGSNFYNGGLVRNYPLKYSYFCGLSIILIDKLSSRDESRQSSSSILNRSSPLMLGNQVSIITQDSSSTPKENTIKNPSRCCSILF